MAAILYFTQYKKIDDMVTKQLGDFSSPVTYWLISSE